MEKLKIVLLLTLYSIVSIVAQIFLLLFIPLYLIGALVWKEEDFYRLVDKLYKDIKKL